MYMKKLISLIVCVLFFTACSSQDTTNTESTLLPVSKTPLIRAETMLHTAIQLQIYHEGQEEAMDEAYAYIEKMEALLSTNLESSDVYKVNQSAGKVPIKVAPETFEIVKHAQQMSQRSSGKFDITIGAVSNLWRIGSDDARKPSDKEIASALTKIDYRKVKLDETNQTIYLEEPGMVMELGGISKGYIADGIKTIFQKHGITAAIINLGGNVIVMGTSPLRDKGWKVGVQDPNAIRGEVVGNLLAMDATVVTSGIYERYLEVDGVKYHHILDPSTGYPLENEISGVTIFTEKSIDADAYSTSMFLFGIKEGKAFIEQQEGVEAVFIDKDKGVHITSGLQNNFELTNKEYHLVDE